jgi:hypothetical protein
MSRASCQNLMYSTYASDNRQCPTNIGIRHVVFGHEIYRTLSDEQMCVVSSPSRHPQGETPSEVRCRSTVTVSEVISSSSGESSS